MIMWKVHILRVLWGEEVRETETVAEDEAGIVEVEEENKIDTDSESGEESTEFTYRMQDNNLTITGYNEKETAVIIPSSIDGYTVTAIGDNTFKDNTKIISIEEVHIMLKGWIRNVTISFQMKSSIIY